MDIFLIILTFAVTASGIIMALSMGSYDNNITLKLVKKEGVPKDTSEPETEPTEANKAQKGLSWDTPKDAYHSTRVLCDEMGLSYEDKNVVCACIFQESQFNNEAVGKNRNTTDWGIVQINDYWHIGVNKTFPSVEYVLKNPEKCVRWMISKYGTEEFGMWVSYTSGAYKKWLEPNSPMWKLKSY